MHALEFSLPTTTKWRNIKFSANLGAEGAFGKLDINRDINSLSNFKRNTSDFIRQLKETGQPVVLTINGKSEIIVQDSDSYQKLLELAEKAEELELTRQALAEADAGVGRPGAEMLAEMQRILDEQLPK